MIRLEYHDDNAEAIGDRFVEPSEKVIDPVLRARGGMACIYFEPAPPHIWRVELISIGPVDDQRWNLDIVVETPEFPDETCWFGFNLMIDLLEQDKERYAAILGANLDGKRPLASNPPEKGIWEWINVREPSFVLTVPLDPVMTFGELVHKIESLEDLIARRVEQVEMLSVGVRSAPKPDESRWTKTVFLCHSNRDKAFARKLANGLRIEGIEVWIDEDEILVGQDFTAKMEEGLTKADFVIVVLSPNFVQRGPWAQEEYRQALVRQVTENRIHILPVMKKNCDVPPLLQTKNYADFRTNFDAGLRRLVSSIRRHGFAESSS